MKGNIKFRLINETDLEFILEIRNNKTTNSQLKNNSNFNIEEAIEWFNTSNPQWLIILNVDDQRVGYFRINDQEIGCDIHPDFRRKGYARAAYTKYLENIQYAELDVFEDNYARNLYKELGFKETGEYITLRGRKYLKMIYKK